MLQNRVAAIELRQHVGVTLRGMDVSVEARSARRTASVLAVGAVIVVILGVVSMHVINQSTRCASPSRTTMTPARAASTGADATLVTTDHSGNPHSLGATHGPNQCTATLVRKALLNPTGATPLVAVTAVAVACVGLLRPRRDRPLVPDPLSIAGGLRR